VVAWPGRSSRSRLDTVRNAATLFREVTRRRFDLVHSFSRVAYLLPILPFPIPKLMTYQREVNRRSVRFGDRLSRGTLTLSAVSRALMHNVEDIGRWRLVYNGVPLRLYDFAPTVAADAPLAFLGRIEEIKGPHIAIDVAERLNARLILAGNIPDRDWFARAIAPRLDGERIYYAGPVTDAQKNALLGGARALLMPILWQEPFGIVMAEAMACGTPVIGFRRGSVPEVVAHGVTGFVVDTPEEMAAAALRLGEISRALVRERAERLFSEDALADGYLAIYRSLLAATRRRR
jgi:glycosyltransferase involved in cell wall biosynthesis